ncbi:MerR family transcriptional regulator [uncultured Desulfovibrio sp.]|uniref:MerR family transcriptional regulator n=1 Tax=uncultured Desulfovibrio sp. TaxID=167968 RepID=UPI0028055FC3|nr:MerR family transcriptional regulator [uncultured Desulfovibrio sp.]
MKKDHEQHITYTPRILRTMAEICEAFGVGEKTVKAWVKQGAPIAVEGDGRKVRYSAEMVRLQMWRCTLTKTYDI